MFVLLCACFVFVLLCQIVLIKSTFPGMQILYCKVVNVYYDVYENKIIHSFTNVIKCEFMISLFEECKLYFLSIMSSSKQSSKEQKLAINCEYSVVVQTVAMLLRKVQINIYQEVVSVDSNHQSPPPNVYSSDVPLNQV